MTQVKFIMELLSTWRSGDPGIRTCGTETYPHVYACKLGISGACKVLPSRRWDYHENFTYSRLNTRRKLFFLNKVYDEYGNFPDFTLISRTQTLSRHSAFQKSCNQFIDKENTFFSRFYAIIPLGAFCQKVFLNF